MRTRTQLPSKVTIKNFFSALRALKSSQMSNFLLHIFQDLNYIAHSIQEAMIAAAVQQHLLRQQQQRPRGPIALVIDTNAWIDHLDEIRELELARWNSPIIVMVPETVIKELEKLEHFRIPKKYLSKEENARERAVRQNARYALNYIHGRINNRTWLMVLNPRMESELAHGGCIANYKMSPDDHILAAAQRLAIENEHLRVFMITQDKSVGLKSFGLRLGFLEGRDLLQLANE